MRNGQYQRIGGKVNRPGLASAGAVATIGEVVAGKLIRRRVIGIPSATTAATATISGLSCVTIRDSTRSAGRGIATQSTVTAAWVLVQPLPILSKSNNGK